jgi:hypothetical protein
MCQALWSALSSLAVLKLLLPTQSLTALINCYVPNHWHRLIQLQHASVRGFLLD